MQLVTICSISIMCISGIFLIITLAYFLAHVTYLYGFENCRETIAVIKDFAYDYEVSYANSGQPILEYYNDFTTKIVRKQMMNTRISSSNACVGDHIKIQYTNKKERVIEPRYVTENTYKVQKYITPPLICALICFISFVVLISSILLEHMG